MFMDGLLRDVSAEGRITVPPFLRALRSVSNKRQAVR